MLDFARVDARHLQDVVDVVAALHRYADISPATVMLVGARCRDLLHEALDRGGSLRATRDLDLGIILADWSAYGRVDRAFRRVGSNGIRYLVGGWPVDIMPFGPQIEVPEGIARPASRPDGIVVFGFADVFERATPLILPHTRQEIESPAPRATRP